VITGTDRGIDVTGGYRERCVYGCIFGLLFILELVMINWEVNGDIFEEY
jgi:hypothetical protein